MAIHSFDCPHCGKHLKSAAGVEAGKNLRCPGCQEPFVVAAPDTEPEAPPRKKAAGKKPRGEKKSDSADTERGSTKTTTRSSAPVFWIRVGLALVAIAMLGVAGYIIYQKRFVGVVVEQPSDTGHRSLRGGEGSGPANPKGK